MTGFLLASVLPEDIRLYILQSSKMDPINDFPGSFKNYLVSNWSGIIDSSCSEASASRNAQLLVPELSSLQMAIVDYPASGCVSQSDKSPFYNHTVFWFCSPGER